MPGRLIRRNATLRNPVPDGVGVDIEPLRCLLDRQVLGIRGPNLRRRKFSMIRCATPSE